MNRKSERKDYYISNFLSYQSTTPDFKETINGKAHYFDIKF